LHGASPMQPVVSANKFRVFDRKQSINFKFMHFLKRTLATAITAALAFVFLPELSQAQAPQAINSQAVARDTSGAPIANKSLNIVVTITDSILFIPVYEETWSAVTTNRFGLFTLQIGRGTTTDDFTTIDWASGSKYLNINIDGVDMGNATELLTVPYALYAETGRN
jgi:hypothetical protein